MTDTPRDPNGQEPTDSASVPEQNQSPEQNLPTPQDATPEDAAPTEQPAAPAEQSAASDEQADVTSPAADTAPSASDPVPAATPTGEAAQPNAAAASDSSTVGQTPQDAASQAPNETASAPVPQQSTGQTAPTASYGGHQQQTSSTDAFGRPVSQPAYAPYPPQQDYATQSGQPAQAGQPQGSPAQPKRKHGTAVLVAALAVGALVGGASGAGIASVITASQAGGTKTVTNSGPANITVNDANNATLVTAVANKVSPSVVTIQVQGTQAGGTGSGVILTDDGYVLTNTHVVTLDGEISDPKIQVRTNAGKLYTAKVVGTDPISDLAVIKLDGASDLTPATWGDSSKLDVGQAAIAIGAPLGLSGTVTDGIVSALNRGITVASSAVPKNGSENNGDNGGNGPFDFWNFDVPGQQPQQQQDTGTISLSVIQTDAPINPGNSGGPLLNSKGQVIGVNVAIAGSGGSSGGQSGSIGLGFAIPSDLAHRVANELMKDGKASHGQLGATVTDATNSDSAKTVGALIAGISDGGAAQKAGLKKGDIITNFNGFPITGMTDIVAQVRAAPGGSKADVTYVRGGETKTVTVTLGEYAQ